jgi:hypothetical protein
MAMGKLVMDEDYTDMLLASLPASYDRAVSSISTSVCLRLKALMVEIFKQFILDKSERQHVKDRYAENRDEAQTTDLGRWKGKDKSKVKKKVKCYNCCKTRHYKSKGWAKGGGKEGQGLQWGKGVKGDTTLAIEQSEETEVWAAIKEIEEPALISHSRDTVAVASYSPAQSEQGHGRAQGELYSSRALRHMSPFDEQFTNYKTILPHLITAADKRIFYAVGTGDLRIKVPNGESSTPIVLKDVLHAPDMGITIVSVSWIT